MQPPFLSGKRILVVEDEALIAFELDGILCDEGAVVVGPAVTLADAIAKAGSEQFDVAVLDLMIQGSASHAVADVLSGRSIPFIFTTGHDQAPEIHSRYADPVVCGKPCMPEEILAGLARVMGVAATTASG